MALVLHLCVTLGVAAAAFVLEQVGRPGNGSYSDGRIEIFGGRQQQQQQ
jgi:hypothetical protein